MCCEGCGKVIFELCLYIFVENDVVIVCLDFYVGCEVEIVRYNVVGFVYVFIGGFVNVDWLVGIKVCVVDLEKKFIVCRLVDINFVGFLVGFVVLLNWCEVEICLFFSKCFG